ncbi:UNVERIFIED_CONTAM: hypothetical protein H355_008507 [Colinus virginianus]|nr:hypothetical protein H355_008507 [Colinus virginianus]
MASGWESERSLEARREQRRREREALLAQSIRSAMKVKLHGMSMCNDELDLAKIDYEKEERRKLQKHLRGEDTWMLPDVNERVEQLEEEHSVKKKKKKDKRSKKSKKEKKKNKKQKSEKKDDDDDDDSSSDSSVEWVESNASQSDNTEKAWKVSKQSDAAKEPTVQREEWMNLDFMSLKTMSLASVKGEREKEKMLERQKAREIEQAVLSERELNPYWKDGGMGLPPEEDESTSVKKVTVIEDAGLSWLRKSYQRMKEQAEREKRNIEEIVAERYGSMEAFQSRLEEAERAAPKKENDYRSGRWKKRDYSENEKKEHRMKDETRHEDGRNMFGGHKREKCGKEWAQEDRGYKKDGSRADQERGHSSRDSELRGYSSQVGKHLDEKRSKEKSVSLSDIKHKFLKPSEDDLPSYSVSGDYRSQGSSSKLPPRSSLSSRFQKPSEDTPLWNKTHGQDSDEKSLSDQKSSDPAAKNDGEGTQSVEKEKSREEYPTSTSTPEKKQMLSDSKTSRSRLPSEDEPPRVLSEDEMNKLGARIVKAELMGNMQQNEEYFE